MMEIDYINGMATEEIFGCARYQSEIHRKLPSVRLNRIEYHRLKIPFTNRGIPYQSNINRDAIYPFLIRRYVKEGNIKHITCQELAYILELFKFDRTIVTCYDLIPYIYMGSRSFNWRRNIDGIRKADTIITISEFSKKEIVKYVGCNENRVRVINPGINHNQFYVNRDKSILKKYNIPHDKKIILYVGSEQPRQNLPSLFKAFAQLKGLLPQVRLIKVGNPQWQGARKELLSLVKELDLENDVVFTGHLLDEELPLWYNCADLLVYPCLYTGWSLPCIEAMACGTPVITSNISVLPEVVGDGAALVDSSNTDELAGIMYAVLTNDALKENLVNKGLQRASMLSWDKAAKETLRVYEELN